MIKKLYQNNCGITILEITISLTLLIIIIIPVTNFYLNSNDVLRYIELKEIALSVAQQEMTKLKRNSFEELTSGTNENDVFKDDIKFKCEIIIKEIDEKVKEININIYHQQNQLIVLKNRIFE